MTDTEPTLAELHYVLSTLRDDVGFIALHMRRFSEIVADAKDLVMRSEKLMQRVDAALEKILEESRNTPTMPSPAPPPSATEGAGQP